MPSKLKSAILDFLANEFKLDPHSLGEDLNFLTDLSLDQSDLLDLLTRLQETLDFNIPEDKLSSIATIEDLFLILGLETENDPHP